MSRSTLPDTTQPAPPVRTLQSLDGASVVGTAAWACPFPGSGVIVIAHLEVAANHRRRGHGSRLLDGLIRDAAGCPDAGRLRRVVAHVAQKSQVQARAFFTRHGFHHTGTLSDLLQDEDVLIYSKAYD